MTVGNNVPINFFIESLSIIPVHEYKEAQKQMMERENNKNRMWKTLQRLILCSLTSFPSLELHRVLVTDTDSWDPLLTISSAILEGSVPEHVFLRSSPGGSD